MYLEYNFEREEEIKKWNFGAMFLPLIWGPCNNCYITLTCLIPIFMPQPFRAYALFTALILHIWFGMYGNKWALENKKWESLEDFRQTQDIWNIAAIAVVAMVVFSPLIAFAFE